ncbi:hypothetical protein B4U80_09644, partial [Leptotrombidium deliense]
ILKQLWPFIDEFVRNLMKETIEPSVVSSLPDYLKSFRFEKVDLGTIPLRIGGVKCYDVNTSRNEIILDLEIIYAGNCDINIKLKGLSAGIKDLQIYGNMRVEMRPLLKESPIVGGLSFYFLSNPHIDFNLTNMADILDFPGLSDVLRKAISEQLAAFIVLPNKYVFPLTEMSMKMLKFTPPMGVLRVEAVEAKQLKKSDIGMLGMGKSDPYCNISIAAQDFKTQTITSSVNPKWNFICEAVIHHAQGQSILIEVMDEDQGSKDDFLGRTSLSLDLVTKHGKYDDWLVLEDTDTGSIHLRANWLTLTTDLSQIDKQIEANKKLHCIRDKNNQVVNCGSTAALFIYLDSAKDLPSFTKTAAEPSPYVVFSLGHEKRRSSLKNDISNPVWEESFYFLMGDPRHENELRAEVIDSKANKTIGYVTINIRTLIQAENMTIDRCFAIRGKGQECELSLSAVLRVLKDADIQSTSKPAVNNNANVTKPVQSTNEGNEKTETANIPSLEEVVFSTIEPILDTSGGNKNMLIASQLDRSDTLRQRSPEENGGNEYKKYPRIQITLSKSPSDKVSIIIHKVENLPSNDHKPDAYIKICPISDHKETKLKTDVKRHTSNPVYEEMFELGSIDLIPNKYEVSVWHKGGLKLSGLFSKSKEIGRTVVDISDVHHSSSLKQWYDLEMKDD